MIQSFAPGEVTPEQALQIGEELCDRFLQGNYQYVLAVHTDKSHVHTHIIFNNTNLYNGLSFTTEHNQGKVRERSWAKLRQISDEICSSHGLSVIAEPEKGQSVSHFERENQKAGTSWKAKLREMLSEIIAYSRDFDDFRRLCKKSGIEAVYSPRCKVKLKFRMDGQERYTRAKTLGEEFEPERIVSAIEQAQNAQAKQNATEPLQPAIQLRQKTRCNEITEEEFIRGSEVHQGDVSDPIPSQDAWAVIREMPSAESIIADLEAGGFTSFDEFKPFFWNTKHSDDHTEELAALKKQITAMDTLIFKMKHRDELAPIYKEYENKSGWAQSRFRKKNAAQIEDYEQTAAYIKKHSSSFTIDGKPAARSALEQWANDLKLRYNAFLPEHNAFLAKKAAAQPYIKMIRKYLTEQRTRETNEQSRQHRLDQQKNALE